MDLDVRDQTATIVCAFVANNHLPIAELPDLISSVHTALAAVAGSKDPQLLEPEKLVPAVNPKRSVFPDHILSLENGKPYRSLIRHLAQLGMTPDQYRIKWNLPSDYPMVAQTYSEARAEFAKRLGLGRRPQA